MSKTKSESAKIAFALPHRSPPKVPEIVFGESKTEQCHKDSCDINLIVAGALQTQFQAPLGVNDEEEQKQGEG